MKALQFSTHNYSPLQKLLTVVLFLNPLVRLCFSKQDLSCPKGLQIGWIMLECKKQTYNTKSSTILPDLACIVEQKQKYNGNNHT